MLIAASVTASGLGYVGTSMMKTWLIRRSVRRPVSFLDHLAHQLVGVQAALHQGLGLARAHDLDRGRGGGVAVGRIDQPVRRDIEAELLGDAPDLGLGTDQDRLDQAGLGRLDRGGQRRLITRMRDRGPTGSSAAQRSISAG